MKSGARTKSTDLNALALMHGITVEGLLQSVPSEKALDLMLGWCGGHFNKTCLSQAAHLALLAYVEQPITLRGLFYRAVSAGVYPDTADEHYRQCGRLLLKLRRESIVPYRFIIDSTRRRLKPGSWSGLADFSEVIAEAYRKDLWERQAQYVEIFVEKDAMAAVIEPITHEYDIHLNVIRGSCSESLVWRIAQEWRSIRKPIFAYYLGDHDPSGLDIERDLLKRLQDMLPNPVHLEWKRMAVNRADFQRSDLLGFPIKGNRTTKAWQTRHRDYLTEYGDRCVEVDAIPAKDIRTLIRHTIESHINQNEWQALQAIEDVERQSVKEFALSTTISKGITTTYHTTPKGIEHHEARIFEEFSRQPFHPHHADSPDPTHR